MDDLISNEPIEGWNYVFLHDGGLGVGKITRSGPLFSELEYELSIPDGTKLIRSIIVNNGNLMNSITDLDKVIETIKRSFDDTITPTEEENELFKKHLDKLYGTE